MISLRSGLAGLTVFALLGLGCTRPDPSAPGDQSAIDGGSAESPDASSSAPEGCADPGGYPAPAYDRWSDLNGLQGQALRDALYERVKDHTWLAYNDARRAMFNPDGGVDVHAGQIECVYTGRTVAAVGATSNGMNVEHTWPQSDNADMEPEVSDIHHLFPADGEANLRRSSTPYAFTDCDQTGTCVWSLGGSKLGEIVGGGQQVFEVRPEMRGDVARAHFYFAVRYQRSIDEFEEKALRCWSYSDPPDDLERARNDAIEAIQGNRNPFVDRPDFVPAISDF